MRAQQVTQAADKFDQLGITALQAELEKLEQTRSASEALLEQLHQKSDEVLLSGSERASVRHQNKIIKAERAIRRADLIRPDLVSRLEKAEKQSAEAEKARAKAEATEAVEAVISHVEERFNKPACEIAAFLTCWENASEKARAAGVPGPDRRLRFMDRVRAGSVTSYNVYVDPGGGEHTTPPPSITGQTVKNKNFMAGWRVKRRTRIETDRIEERYREALASVVRLPGAGLDDPPFWPKV
jgi:hypothetical protein